MSKSQRRKEVVACSRVDVERASSDGVVVEGGAREAPPPLFITRRSGCLVRASEQAHASTAHDARAARPRAAASAAIQPAAWHNWTQLDGRRFYGIWCRTGV